MTVPVWAVLVVLGYLVNLVPFCVVTAVVADRAPDWLRGPWVRGFALLAFGVLTMVPGLLASVATTVVCLKQLRRVSTWVFEEV